MKKITAQSLCVTLLFSFVVILVLGQLSPVKAQSISRHENTFNWFLLNIGCQNISSTPNTFLAKEEEYSRLICVDEDNGSLIEAKLGQKITIMLNCPRVETKEEN